MSSQHRTRQLRNHVGGGAGFEYADTARLRGLLRQFRTQLRHLERRPDLANARINVERYVYEIETELTRREAVAA